VADLLAMLREVLSGVTKPEAPWGKHYLQVPPRWCKEERKCLSKWNKTLKS